MSVATNFLKFNFMADDCQVCPMGVYICYRARTHFAYASVLERRAKKKKKFPWKLGRLLLFVFSERKF